MKPGSDFRRAGLRLSAGWGEDVRGRPLDAGDFFPEKRPDEIADALRRFFS
jgi:hypothetical protein